MKILYTFIAILIIYSSISYLRIVFILSQANLPEIVQQDRTIGSGPTLKYVAAGDSTAVGEGASAVGQTYTYKIAENLARTNTVEYVNVGVRGARTDDFLKDQITKIISTNPDLITISIGANDVTHLNSTGNIVRNFTAITNELTQKTNAQIYLTNIPIVDRVTLLPYPYTQLMGYQVKKINQQLQALESNRVHIIDIHEFGWDNFPDIRSTFAKDQFHPNDTGYENWTKAFLSKIKLQYSSVNE